MVGHHWQSAEATIVATKVAVITAAGYVNRLEYAVDVHPTDGTDFRVTLREPKLIVNALPIRQRVFVENDSALVDCQSV